MNSEKVISVDVGGTNILTALLEGGKIVQRLKIPTDISKGRAHFVKSIIQSIGAILEENSIGEEEIKAVCLGVPGTVNPETGVIGNAPNLNIRNYNIKNPIQKMFNIPVLIENDVNLGAIGIKHFEFPDKINNMLVVFIGTGIGGALIFEGKLYRGSTFYAGEIGHMKVHPDGKFSTFTKKEDYTLEKVASRTAIVKVLEKEMQKGKKTILKKSVKPKQKIKSKALAEAILKNDSLVKKEMKRACKSIGTVLGSLTTLLNFDTIVLGGGVVEAAPDFMLENIKKYFGKAVLPEPGSKVNIRATKLGDDAPLLGGVPLAEEFLKN